MSEQYFISGTDTEIGKTFVTNAFIHKALSQGISCLGMKPIAAGTDIIHGKLSNLDVASYINLAPKDVPSEDINPVFLKEPFSPNIAADRQNTVVYEKPMLEAFTRMKKRCDLLFVEGVGGFKVPLRLDYLLSDLVKDMNIPVILVVGMRLGCINHSLLSVEAIANSGAKLAGWVANQIDPNMSAINENIATLKKLINAPMLGHLSYQKNLQPKYAIKELILPKQV